MTWLYLVVMIFSALTLYFTYGEYKQNRFSKKAYKLAKSLADLGEGERIV